MHLRTNTKTQNGMGFALKVTSSAPVHVWARACKVIKRGHEANEVNVLSLLSCYRQHLSAREGQSEASALVRLSCDGKVFHYVASEHAVHSKSVFRLRQKEQRKPKVCSSAGHCAKSDPPIHALSQAQLLSKCRTKGLHTDITSSRRRVCQWWHAAGFSVDKRRASVAGA